MSKLRDALFSAGPQWGDRKPDDILAAIDAAGFVVVPKEPSREMLAAVVDELEGWDRRFDRPETIADAIFEIILEKQPEDSDAGA